MLDLAEHASYSHGLSWFWALRLISSFTLI